MTWEDLNSLLIVLQVVKMDVINVIAVIHQGHTWIILPQRIDNNTYNHNQITLLLFEGNSITSCFWRTCSFMEMGSTLYQSINQSINNSIDVNEWIITWEKTYIFNLTIRSNRVDIKGRSTRNEQTLTIGREGDVEGRLLVRSHCRQFHSIRIPKLHLTQITRWSDHLSIGLSFITSVSKELAYTPVDIDNLITALLFYWMREDGARGNHGGSIISWGNIPHTNSGVSRTII